MAISRVQGPVYIAEADDSVTASFANTPTSGNLLIAFGSSDDVVIASASIAGFSLITSAKCSANISIGLWYKVAGGAESKDVTLHWHLSTGTRLIIEEWSGLDPAPLDNSAAHATDDSSVTSWASGTTANTTAAVELCIAAFGTGGNVTAQSWSDSFTESYAADRSFLGYRVVTSTGTYTTTLSWTTSRKCGGLIATFKALTVQLVAAEGYQTQASDGAVLSFPLERESTEVYSGAYSLKVNVGADGANVGVEQGTIRLRPGCKGRVRFRAKSTVVSPGIALHWRLHDAGDNVWLNSTTGAWGAAHDNEVPGVTDADWTAVSYDFTASPSYSVYEFSVCRGTDDYGATYSFYVDDASVLRLLEPTPYRAIIPLGGAPSITQAVGDFYIGDVALSAGELKYGNDGWWYTALDAYIWHLKECWLKVGAIDSTYSELGTIFWGRTTRPMVTDEAVTFQVADAREGLFGSIPTAIYDLTAYPDMDPDAVGQAIPILFGELGNLTPVCIDTVLFQYLVAGHALEDISAVYKDGVVLATPGDYSADPATAIIDLVADPLNSVITCKAKGAKCKIEDGTYSALGADILYHVLTALNSPAIPKSMIDLVSFFDLRTARTQVLAAYLNEQIAVTDFVRKLQDSNVFHLIPLLNGTFGAFRYAAGTTGAETRIDQLDMASFTLSYDTAPVRKTVVVKYGMDPTETDKWLAVSATDPNIGFRYDQAEILEKETLLTSGTDAALLATFFLNLIRSPEKRVAGSVPALLLGHRPAEKIVISMAIRSGEGVDQTVLAAEVYRALTLVKNAGPATVDLEAVLDLQSTGAVHNDVAHGDVAHEDSHTDTPYEDHTDSSDHEDEAHGNTAHNDDWEDVPYHDHPHEETHGDSHTDTAHTDTHANTHGDSGYDDDGPPHTDTHVDTHVDTHGDVYTDTYTDTYTDEHTDVPYYDHHWNTAYWDDPHGNSGHSDEPHVNVAHGDVEHEDSHTDTPHGDSEY